ncbi:Bug family tripartite tricarboxylate transporter substrate binding protein [Achromobacter aloeverae]|uniref:Tripartite tricarboxylate transporter substrate binding protein n=1 Tax=Achromobacter aloeverae TaxID=1750518 RepID=A0A4Q1HGA1_9BURK|nr:tripartite tricarboxylate transporter substrate binding protein [Achromobacter aloeverae]RXN86139.1 tripartite tricarboxylate transporter substrate binding protein [Achromobacter aloeverae]
MERRSALKIMALIAGMGQAARTWGEGGAYPARPIKIIVSATPGSATDLAGRLVGDLLNVKYGQGVVVENRAGAGGVIGMQAAASSRPDGYTLATGGLGNNVLPPVTLRGLPLDIPAALRPVAQVAEFVNALVVRVDHPANSVPELIEYLRASKRKPLYGSNGVGSSSQMTAELFALRVGMKFDHVPYKGATEVLVGTANSDLDFCFMNLPPTLPMVEGRHLKALAVTSSYRARQLPGVPTMQEQGVKDFDVTSWLGIYAPSKVEPAIIDQLSSAIVTGLATPEYQKRIIGAGFEPKLRNAAEFQAFSAAELKRWGDVARQAGIVVEYGGAKG